MSVHIYTEASALFQSKTGSEMARFLQLTAQTSSFSKNALLSSSAILDHAHSATSAHLTQSGR